MSRGSTPGWGLLGIGVTGLLGVPALAATLKDDNEPFQLWMRIGTIASVLAICVGLGMLLRRGNQVRVRIDDARYGAEDCGYDDVTTVLRAAVSSTGLRVAVSNDELVRGDDPCPYMLKELVVTYALNGVGQPQVHFREGDDAVLPLPADWGPAGPPPAGLAATPHFSASEAEKNIAEFLVWAGNLLAGPPTSDVDVEEWKAAAQECLDGLAGPLADSLDETRPELADFLRTYSTEPVAIGASTVDELGDIHHQLRQARRRLATVLRAAR